MMLGATKVESQGKKILQRNIAAPWGCNAKVQQPDSAFIQQYSLENYSCVLEY